uniref:Ssu-2 homolog n=1 Tax=Oreochromis aureus TaxID=47969 RepID=A0A668UQR0_OREAU
MPTFPAVQPEPALDQPHIPSISENTARDALLLFVKSKCCYSSAPAKDGVITNMEAFNTYRYRLETFTESRSTEWSHEPYTGQTVDAYAQQPPGPWDIPAKTPQFFLDDKQFIKVPYTSSVKPCHNCLGIGRKPCKDCAGAGNVSILHGSCHGQGSRQCDVCKGKQQLLVYIKLTVKWCILMKNYLASLANAIVS